MLNHRPILMVMAGPNGSGKSTVTSGLDVIGEYVNADEIKRYLGCDDLTAAKNAEATRESLLSDCADFTFETVLSTPRNLDLMRRAKNSGYHVRCIYVITYDSEINVRRVADRVRKGGHSVPKEKVVERYKRAMTLIPELFDIVDELYMYDNSPERGVGEPSLIVSFTNGETKLFPNDIWSLTMLKKLISGKHE